MAKKKGATHWKYLWHDIINLYPRVIQPKFIFISFVTLAVSTCGIWIGPFFLHDKTQVAFSIFSFVITTLGVLAAEKLSKGNEKEELTSLSEKYRKEVTVSFSIFLWFVSFVLSFYGLKNNVNVWLMISFFITLILWCSITVVKPDFAYPINPDEVVNEEINNVGTNDEPGEGI